MYKNQNIQQNNKKLLRQARQYLSTQSRIQTNNNNINRNDNININSTQHTNSNNNNINSATNINNNSNSNNNNESNNRIRQINTNNIQLRTVQIKNDEQDTDSQLWNQLINHSIVRHQNKNINNKQQYERNNKNNVHQNVNNNINSNYRQNLNQNRTANLKKQNNNYNMQRNTAQNIIQINNNNNLFDLDYFLDNDQQQQQQIKPIQINNNDHNSDSKIIEFSQKYNNFMTKNFVKSKTNSFQNNNNQSIKYQNNEQNYQSQIINNGINKKQKQNKGKKVKKQQNNKQQYQNIIKTKNQNLFTIDKLKVQAPLICNYIIGDKTEWQNNKKIQDYKLTFALRKFPKIKQFRHNQKAIIKCSLLGNDVFVCMPTGGGKSLTFQAMTFIQKGIYLCILPLVSLIIDQQDQANKIGIKAYSLTGAKQQQDNKHVYYILENYQLGTDSVVIFCTPEKINKSPQFFKALEKAYQRNSLVKIIIDEVHCVSTWGKQFRQDYLILSSLRQNFPKTPILGLTATVTQVIKQDIIRRLGLKNCYYFQSSFNRPNLYYQVKQKNKDVLNNIIKIIQQYQNKSGIIYCVSRKDCQEMCKQLKNKRYKVAFYHANISENQKRDIQGRWMKNQIQIIIATIAFGMGINKPDVRFVIHHSLSKSLQNYYQQSGRAGRDGQNAKCILLYRKSDKISLQSLIMKNQISADENKSFCMKQLSNMIRYCQDKYSCRRKFQLQYLGQKDFNVQECNKTCDNCKRGLKYVQIQCINQAKAIVKFVQAMDKVKQNISQNQIIMICKGTNDKKFKYKMEQISKLTNLSELRGIFAKWNKQNIDQLITQLLTYGIFYEKLLTTNTFKNNVVSNFYIKLSYQMANKFLQKVQTLPMKRNLAQKKYKQKQNVGYDLEDYEFDFEDLQEIVGNQDDLATATENGFQSQRYSFQGKNSKQ